MNNIKKIVMGIFMFILFQMGYSNIVNAATYETAWFPAPQLYVTQLAYESASHGQCNAIDIAPGGRAFAPFTGTVKRKDPNWGYVLFQSNDKVHFADGSLDYMTVGFMHDENISDIYVGQVIQQGTPFYDAGGQGKLNGGGYGHVYANHIDISVFRGKVDSVSSYGRGNTFAYDAFCINTSRTTVVKKGVMESRNHMTNGAPSNWENLWRTTGHNPFGNLDGYSGGNGTISISGWVADWDDPGAALQVHVYVGGPAGSGVPGYAITANKYRSDVNDVLPGIGNYHGFEDTIAVSPRGNQKLYIYGLNVGGGENILLVTADVTINEPVYRYSLDVNGMLDGREDGGLGDYGTCDVYINGELKADDCNDFYSANGTWEQGAKYEIKDIKATKCHKYEGVHSGSLSGTLNGNTSVSLEFTIAHDYDVEIIETTCTVLGSKTYTCKNCGYSYTENDTELLPHDYRQEAVEATCVNPAGTKYSCKNCGHTYTEYAEADWSDWSETYPEGIDKKLIESRTEYSYSDKKTTTSENPSLSGWTQTGSEAVYGGWGGWSAWQTDPITSSDTVNVASEKAYRYYYFYCPVCGGREPFQGRSDCGKYTLTLSDAHVGWFALPYSQSNPQSYSYTTAKVYTTAPDGNRWNFSKRNLNDTAIGTLDDGNGAVVITTGYRSRTRTKTMVYKYEKWEKWSDWTATAVNGSSDRQVKTRTVYRYNRTPYGNHSYDEGTISNNTITYKCVNCDEIKEMPLIMMNDNFGVLVVKLAETNKITAQGIVYGKGNDITLETPGRARISYSETDSNRSYSFDATELTGCTIRAYVLYTDQNGNEQVVYSESYSR